VRISREIISWAIKHLGSTCHPFLGISFLAAKASEMPVGESREMSLDAITRKHLQKFHRLDVDSEFFFQPFKSIKFWVDARYPSSGLQAINTQTFGDAFIHPARSKEWGFVNDYAERISDRIEKLTGIGKPSLAALAIWTLKDRNFESTFSLDELCKVFCSEFSLSNNDIDLLFNEKIRPSDKVQFLSEQTFNLKVLAYEFDVPPDAPSETEGTLTSIKLQNVGPADLLELDFGERLTLIAGDNGLGKSFLLDAAWWAITNSWAGKAAYPFRIDHSAIAEISYKARVSDGREEHASTTFDWQSHSWKTPASPLPISALTIYAKVDGSFAILDEVRGQVRVGRDSSVNIFTSEDVWGGSAEIEGLIRDWVTWQKDSDGDTFAMLTRVLEHLSPDDIGPLTPGQPIRLPGSPRWTPTIRHAYGDVPITLASAGVRRVLILAYLVIWTWEEHQLAAKHVNANAQAKMVIIIDELEAHLHPKWQRLVLPALLSVGKLLSEELEVQIIAATHSPMVLASIEAEFSEESDMLAHLKLEDSKVVVEPLDFYKYGDMSSWLTSPVFGLSHARSQRAGKVIDQAKELQLSSDPSKDDVYKINEELKNVLSPDDQFWNRWLFFAQRMGVEA